MSHILSTIMAMMLITACTVQALPPAEPFGYRALWTPSNILKDSEIKPDSAHNVDNDWALWGHNINRELNKGYYRLPEEAYSMIDGRRDSTQLCFSSRELLKMLDEWIADQWGTRGERFTIMPMDNKKACMCDGCRKLGNTTTSATPAVTSMVTRLASRYPRHQFFLTAYHTTMTPPEKSLPNNVGVMVSTMGIPMRYEFRDTKGFKKLDAMLRQWGEKTKLLYVWDYNRNFDDYLTPYPCLNIMQRRLQYYKEVGVQGVFINGSGYDYSTMDDMQSWVLARLLLNCNDDVDGLVRQFYRKYYPATAGLLTKYYLGLEHKVMESNHALPYYGTIEETQESYLNRKEFIDFWTQLDKESKDVRGQERTWLNRMLTAMAFTRLQLKPADEDEQAEMRLILEDYKTVPHLLNYKETEGSLEDYLKGK